MSNLTIPNQEQSVKDAITRFQQEQRQAALIWDEKHKNERNEKASSKYSSRYITKYHDRFDYFK